MPHTPSHHMLRNRISVLLSDPASSRSVQGLWCRHHLGVRGRNSSRSAGLQEHGSAPGKLPPLPPLPPLPHNPLNSLNSLRFFSVFNFLNIPKFPPTPSSHRVCKEVGVVCTPHAWLSCGSDSWRTSLRRGRRQCSHAFRRSRNDWRQFVNG